MPQQMTATHPPGPMLGPRPPLAAYREDLARLRDRDAFGPLDATWLSAALVLSHGVDVPADSRRSLLETLHEVVGTDPWVGAVLAVGSGEAAAEFELDAVSPAVRAIVEQMEDAGALSLAYSTLSILAEADVRLSALERGRVLAQRGRIAWKAGAHETAREQYRCVEVLGRAARLPELRVRAWIGYAVLAQLRGNYPEMRKWSARAAHVAGEAGLGALRSLAYHNLMRCAAVAGDLGGALVFGWRAYDGAVGDPAREAEALLNLAELLLRSGRPEAAIRGFAAALARRPAARLELPTLGGLASAAAALRDGAGVRTAWGRAEELIGTAGLPYEAAAALVEFAQAFAAIGDREEAAGCRVRALEIAQAHGYHELTHRLAALDAAYEPSRNQAPHALGPRATEVARTVASLGLVGAVRD